MRKQAGRQLRTVTASTLAGLLALGFPGTGLSAPAGAPTEAEGVLSVQTEPAGAAVFVDGLMQGATPLQLPLPAGEHRVKVVKDGYLENGRVVSLRAGQASAVDIKLTPSPASNVRLMQVDDTSGGGGGGGKWLLIGLGAVGVGAAVYFLTRDTNDPPVAALSITPTGTGMAGATSYAFSGSGSTDPDGDSLTYSWNFGDGGSGTGVSTTHVYASAGTFTATLTVSDGKESSTATGTVTVNRNLTGSWTGSLQGFATTTLTFTQSGSTLSGTYRDGLGFNGSVSGSVTGPTFVCPCTVTFTVTVPGFDPFTFRGSADAGVARLTGNAFGSGFTGESWTLAR